MNRDFRGRFGEAFADSDVKWYLGPAPVIDMQSERDEGFGGGIWLYILFAAIAGNGFAIDRAFGVLGANDLSRELIGFEPAQ